MIVSRKKDQCAETLRDMRNEHASLDKQLKEKKKSLGDDGENLSEEEVKKKRSLILILFKFNLTLKKNESSKDMSSN